MSTTRLLRAVPAGLCLMLSAVLPQAVLAAGPQIPPGVYRIDLNGKVRELCVDAISNGELSAAGWRERLADQGVRCSLSVQKQSRTQASWTGQCSAPGMGKVFNTQHAVSVEIKPGGDFELLTLLSGDLQARIPVRGERMRAPAGGGKTGAPLACDSQQDIFRPWQ